jgi:hypothetical protein
MPGLERWDSASAAAEGLRRTLRRMRGVRVWGGSFSFICRGRREGRPERARLFVDWQRALKARRRRAMAQRHSGFAATDKGALGLDGHD